MQLSSCTTSPISIPIKKWHPGFASLVNLPITPADTVDIEDLFVTLVGNKIDLESKRVIVKAGV